MRTEHDSMGAMEVPDEALYGASTARAVRNFPISGHPMPRRFVHALALVKLACARANAELGRLDPDKARLVEEVAREILAGRHDDQFPVDVFQTGSATSTNTNANEVVANRASQLRGEPLGSKRPLHPNDDVNLGQSSNDVIPTALHVSVALALRDDLAPAIELLRDELAQKATELDDVVKLGRTHLMDATPMTVGQELSGYARQMEKALARTHRAIDALSELALGGTAVGTGLNGHPDLARRVCRILEEETGLVFVEARNHFEAQAARDDSVEVAGELTAIAVAATKIANDFRLLASGPRSGLGELRLPATQPGSSIMPGKVNPVMSEMLVQVAAYVQGLCAGAAIAGREGQLELNATLPFLSYALHEAIRCLANGLRVFASACVRGLEVDRARMAELVERSLMLVTALTPRLGYDVAAEVAHEALLTNRTLREVVLARKLLDAETLDALLDPRHMLGSGAPLSESAARRRDA